MRYCLLNAFAETVDSFQQTHVCRPCSSSFTTWVKKITAALQGPQVHTDHACQTPVGILSRRRENFAWNWSPTQCQWCWGEQGQNLVDFTEPRLGVKAFLSGTAMQISYNVGTVYY